MKLTQAPAAEVVPRGPSAPQGLHGTRKDTAGRRAERLGTEQGAGGVWLAPGCPRL